MGIVRRTFFRHFCAGVDSEDIKKPVARLKECGVGSILDYAAEADVNAVSEITASDEEAACESNAKLIAECIDAASQSVDGFTAVKLTALGRATVLERCSQIHQAIHNLFQQFDSVRLFIQVCYLVVF
jgi:proline dehydrogenase